MSARPWKRFGSRYALVAGQGTDKPWGQASTELVRLGYDENAVGVIAVGRSASHLAEQLAVKSLVPLVAYFCRHCPDCHKHSLDLPRAGRHSARRGRPGHGFSGRKGRP